MAAANCKAKGSGKKTNAKDVEESKSKWQISMVFDMANSKGCHHGKKAKAVIAMAIE